MVLVRLVLLVAVVVEVVTCEEILVMGIGMGVIAVIAVGVGLVLSIGVGAVVGAVVGLV